MKNIFDVKDCYGCGLCAVVCSHKVIDIVLDADGFYQPHISDRSRCVGCGLCARVCSYVNEFNAKSPLNSYAAWSRDQEVIRTSASGGVCHEIARALLAEGYSFCGVRYAPEHARAEHFIANDTKSLLQSKGSKYLQSYTLAAFANVDRKQKHLVVGTPCQIASFRRYVDMFNRTDNFILMDFFCHGVPSYLLWQKYLEEHGNGLGPIRSASWRDKKNGWRNSYCITLESEDKTFHSSERRDDFFTMFLGDACLGKACYESCKFKYGSSAADIRIGDFWGEAYKSNQEGVSSVIVYSERGDRVLHEADLVLEQHPLEIVAAGQMKRNPPRPWYYGFIMRLLRQKSVRLGYVALLVRLLKRLHLSKDE